LPLSLSYSVLGLILDVINTSGVTNIDSKSSAFAPTVNIEIKNIEANFLMIDLLWIKNDCI